MKTCPALFTLTWLSAACFVCGQDAQPTPSPPPVALSYPSTDGIAIFSIPAYTEMATTPFHVYGGDSPALLVTAQAPLGTHLRIYADVSQVAGGILAPWQRNAPVSEEILFRDRTSARVVCKLPELRAVQRKTCISVTLRTEPKMADYPGGLVIQGFVFPREETGAWQKRFVALLARTGVRRVAVFGRWKNPASFLRETKIAFDDLGNDWPAHPDAGTLYLASGVVRDGKDAPLRVSKAFVETRGVRLVLFEPWDVEVLPPGVYQTAGTAGGGVWKVTLPDLFVGAGMDQPHELEILTTLFEQILPARQSAADTADNPEPTP